MHFETQRARHIPLRVGRPASCAAPAPADVCRLGPLAPVRLALCASYALPFEEGVPRDEIKRRLTALLLDARRPYDLAKLDEHRAAAAAAP